MPQARQTRWQKEQEAAEAFGGRSYAKDDESVFDRVKTLKKPRASDVTPVFLTDDIAKDVYFPMEIDDISDALSKMPAADTQGITHIWLRRAKPSEFRSGRIPFAEYVALDGIHLLVFYPWPHSMVFMVSKKPADVVLNRYKKWSPELFSRKGKWYIKWKEELVKDFYLNDLLKYQVGRHVDFRQRQLSQASRPQRIELPVQYANQRYFEESVVVN